MKIGIDCRTILDPDKGEKAGIGHYTQRLVKALLAIDKKNEYVLFFDDAIDAQEYQKENVQVVRYSSNTFIKALPFVYSHAIIPSIINKSNLDIYHNPANILPYYYNKPSVITVHDLAIYYHPEWFPRKIFKQAFATKFLVPGSLKKAKKIIAVSENTKKDIIKLFDINEEKIVVIHEGIEHNKVTISLTEAMKKMGLENDWILNLGTIEPRKNITTLIKAYNEYILKNNDSAPDLVLVGAKGWSYHGVFKLMARINSQAGKEKIKYLGYVSPAEKTFLLHNCIYFVFPSLYEGFGLPVLEAMSHGASVIASKGSSLPEIVGEAGILVNTANKDELGKAMQRLYQDNNLQYLLSQKAKKRASEFTLEKMARETLGVYEELQKENK